MAHRQGRTAREPLAVPLKSLLNPLTLLVVYSRIALPHPENLVRPELLLDNEATRTHYLGHPLLDQAATRW